MSGYTALSGTTALSRLARFSFACVMLLLAAESFAHARAETYAQMLVSGTQIDIKYSIAQEELAERLPQMAFAPNLETLLIEAVPNAYRLTLAGTPCTLNNQPSMRKTHSSIELSWQLSCVSDLSQTSSDNVDLVLNNQALYDHWPNQLHMLQVRHTGENGLNEFVFSQAGEVTLDEASPNTGFMNYLSLGFNHILDGLDHLAFLLCLLLATTSLRTLLWLISGFTLGHSITLFLAVTNITSVNMSAIEALIGFSIAMVAGSAVLKHKNLTYFSIGLSLILVGQIILISLDVVTKGPSILTLVGLIIFVLAYFQLEQRPKMGERIQLFVTGLFGLIHGFGFAGFLLEIALPLDNLVPALLGFNIGVELGQICFILACLLLLAGLKTTLRRYSATHSSALGESLYTVFGSTLFGLGLFWYAVRSI